jgi:small subunit ribosomal protein S17
MAVKERVGIVISNKMQKTVVVSVENRSIHPKYGKVIVKTKKYKVHDEENQCQEGDRVLISETRPLSRTKRWMLSEILSFSYSYKPIQVSDRVSDINLRDLGDVGSQFSKHEIEKLEKHPEMVEEPFMDKIDSYILFDIGISNRSDLDAKINLETKISMLVTLNNNQWNSNNVPGLEIKNKFAK